MKYLLATSALVAASFIAPAFAQQAPKPPVAESTEAGTLTVEGVEPSKVLGAIDTSKLIDQPAPADELDRTAEAPQSKTQVTVDETTVQTADAKLETKAETVAQALAANPD